MISYRQAKPTKSELYEMIFIDQLTNQGTAEAYAMLCNILKGMKDKGLISNRQADLMDTLRYEKGKATYQLEFQWLPTWKNLLLKHITPVSVPIAGGQLTLEGMVKSSPAYKRFVDHGSVKNVSKSWEAVRAVCSDMAKRYKKTKVGNPKEAFPGIFLVEVEIDLS